MSIRKEVFCIRLVDNSSTQNKKLRVRYLNAAARYYLDDLGVFEGRQYLVYDKCKDPYDGQMLACISAYKDDVAACETFTRLRFLMGAKTGPMEVPDYFRYVILDEEEEVQP